MLKPLDEALGFYEAFRRMGFSPDQLFFGMDKSKQVFMVLWSHDREFIATCGKFEGTEENVLEIWKERATWWNSESTYEERDQLWKSCYALNHAGELVSALVLKGFELPAAALDEVACA